MSEWQPIETAPRDGREILLYRGPGFVIEDGIQSSFVLGKVSGQWVGGWDERSDTWFCSFEVAISRVSGCSITMWTKPTHWMPLPEAPKP